MFDIGPNNFFYLFSTVAQALAAAAAILAAFAIHRFARIDDEMQFNGSELSKKLQQPQAAEAARANGDGDFDKVLELTAEFKDAEEYHRLKTLKGITPDIRCKFKLAMITTLVVLITSVMSILFVPKENCVPNNSLLVSAALFCAIAFALCLVFYGCLIRALIRFIPTNRSKP